MPADEAPLWGFAGATPTRTRAKKLLAIQSFLKMSLLSSLDLQQTSSKLVNHDALQPHSLQTSLSLKFCHEPEHPQPP